MAPLSTDNWTNFTPEESDDVPSTTTVGVVRDAPLAGETMVTVGGVASIVIETEAVAEFPALSVALTVIVWEPSASLVVGAYDQEAVPAAWTKEFASILIWTFAIPEASDALPEIVGADLFRRVPFTGEVIVTDGGVLSTATAPSPATGGDLVSLVLPVAVTK